MTKSHQIIKLFESQSVGVTCDLYVYEYPLNGFPVCPHTDFLLPPYVRDNGFNVSDMNSDQLDKYCGRCELIAETFGSMLFIAEKLL